MSNLAKEVRYFKVNYPPYGQFLLKATNPVTIWRGVTFHKKEPTTLEWLQRLSQESWLFDVGANIGIYTIPASLFHVGKVISVEPEPLNYFELLTNLRANNIPSSKVVALPLAISTKYANQQSKLFLSQDMAGQSLHQVGENQNPMLIKEEKNKIEKSIYCISLAHLILTSNLPTDVPLHIKIDVDGIEADVCDSLFVSGLIHRISSIQVELNPSHVDKHKALRDKILGFGFTYSSEQIERARSNEGTFKDSNDKDGPSKECSNYIFIPSKPPSDDKGIPLSDSIKKQHEVLVDFYS